MNKGKNKAEAYLAILLTSQLRTLSTPLSKMTSSCPLPQSTKSFPPVYLSSSNALMPVCNTTASGNAAGCTVLNAPVDLPTLLGTPIAGDYNGDSLVDTNDYNQWKADFGSSTTLRSDGNHNGIERVHADLPLRFRGPSGTLPAFQPVRALSASRPSEPPRSVAPSAKVSGWDGCSRPAPQASSAHRHWAGPCRPT